jgi:hypothetical protein
MYENQPPILTIYSLEAEVPKCITYQEQNLGTVIGLSRTVVVLYKLLFNYKYY